MQYYNPHFLPNYQSQELFHTLNTKKFPPLGLVLDVGTCDGRHLSLLKVLDAKEIFACDPEPNKEELRRNMRDAGVKWNHFYKRKVQDMPEKLKGTFDTVVLFQAMIDIKEQVEFFKAIKAMLKKDESILIMSISENFLVNGYVQSAKEAGLYKTHPLPIKLFGIKEINEDSYTYPNQNILFLNKIWDKFMY